MLDYLRDAPPSRLGVRIELRGIEGTKHAREALTKLNGLGAELCVKVALNHLHKVYWGAGALSHPSASADLSS